MDAHIEAHRLNKEGVDTDTLIDHLGEALTSLYGSAIDCMKTAPNPTLAQTLINHYTSYLQGSVSEELAENIEILRKLTKENRVATGR